MLSFYFVLLGMYLYYAKSRYFPVVLHSLNFPGSGWLGAAFISLGSVLFVRTDGLAGGLLLSLAACSLAMMLIQLFAVLGEKYFYGFVTAVHCLLLTELISYAS